jgi:endonuclease-3
MKNKNSIEKIINILKEIYPSNDKTTLNRMRNKPNAFKILISCLLSLRARDENTEIVSKKLFKVADTPKKILSLDQKELEKIIYSSGHYKKKANVLKSVSSEIIKRFDNKVPDNHEDLISIKGIGPKTANIVLAFAYGKEVIPVDVHVHVIANRLNWTNTKKPEQTEKDLMKTIPKKHWKELNSILVQFGRETCITISPKCSICPIKKYCPKKGVIKSR